MRNICEKIDWIFSISNQYAKAKINRSLTLSEQKFVCFLLYYFQNFFSLNYEKYLKENNIKKENNNLLINENPLLGLGSLDLNDCFVNDYAKIFNIIPTNAYKQIKEFAEKITSIKVELFNKNINKYELHVVFPSFKYQNGYIYISLNKNLAPHVLYLKEKFVLNNLKIISKFKHKYTLFFYNQFKSTVFQNSKGLVKFEINELREKLHLKNLKSYFRFPLFYSKIIKPSINEINNYTKLKINLKKKELKNKKTFAIIFWVENNENYKKNNYIKNKLKKEINKSPFEQIFPNENFNSNKKINEIVFD